ncbi:hypothetical protein [Gaetbulibacter jejuensis]|uniref:Class IIb bacteriocin, lactobin A/cerein 7B family n=1 Tax=Gaetbulibacter jejuensis TaxID=584607 RepID=A0ABN1JGP7_9FLAO
MKTLELNQMENVEGGISLGCGFAILGAGIALGSLIVASGGTAAVVLAAAGWSIAPSAVALSCME